MGLKYIYGDTQFYITGTVKFFEKPIDCTIREMEEEIGFTCNYEDLISITDPMKINKRRQRFHIYSIKSNSLVPYKKTEHPKLRGDNKMMKIALLISGKLKNLLNKLDNFIERRLPSEEDISSIMLVKILDIKNIFLKLYNGYILNKMLTYITKDKNEWIEHIDSTVVLCKHIPKRLMNELENIIDDMMLCYKYNNGVLNIYTNYENILNKNAYLCVKNINKIHLKNTSRYRYNIINVDKNYKNIKLHNIMIRKENIVNNILVHGKIDDIIKISEKISTTNTNIYSLHIVNVKNIINMMKNELIS